MDRDPTLNTPHFVRRRGGFLTPPAPHATTEQIVAALIRANARAFTLHPSDLQPPKARVHQDFRTQHNGLRHVRWQQRKDGIDIYGATFALNLTRENEIVNVSSRALHLPEVRFHRIETLSKEQAMERASAHIGVESIDPSSEFSRSPSHIWYPLDMASAVLSWDLTAQAQDRSAHRLIIRADTGQIVEDVNLTWGLQDATYHVFTNDSPRPYSPGAYVPTNFVPPIVDRTWVTLAALNTNASPVGWIPDGNNTTTGNNIDAYADWDDNDQPDSARPRPQGSPYRLFDPTLVLTNALAYNNTAAAVVQAFYLGNVFHDRLYELGFDESAGNFQENNFGRGGVAADSIHIQVQDGFSKGKTDNAYFTGFGDGGHGKIELCIYNDRVISGRDSALDAEIVFHEAAHGVSTRLIGDGFGLSTTQSRGMGEGWSDFVALSLLSEVEDDVNGCYAYGAYVSGTASVSSSYWNAHYFGSRRFPYSTDLQKAPQTFADTDPNQIEFPFQVPMNPAIWGTKAVADEVHRIGEVWCLALWECRANLMERDRFAGNQKMLRLVVDGMKLTPVKPNFAQARDAILQADLVNHGGTNQIALWRGFAKRGLGYSARVPNAISTVGIVEAFDLPFRFEPMLTERSGDADGYVEPGETGDLRVRLVTHEMNLTNIHAVLSTENSNVTVTTSTAFLSRLAAGQTGVLASTFAVTVGPEFGGLLDAEFKLRIETDQGWFEQPVQVRIGNPNDFPPEIIAVAATNITETNAWIGWITGIPANGRVEYGTTTSYEFSTALDANLQTNHLVELTGLSKGTVYYYRIVSRGDNGLAAQSEGYTLRTRSRIHVSALSMVLEELGTLEAPFKTLQAAAEAARVTGDEILVARGTYTSTNRDAVLFLDGDGWNLVIHGGYSSDFSQCDPVRFAPTIDGERQRGGIRLDNGARLVISGVTVTRGQHEWGGGISVRKSSLIADTCVLTDNSSTNGVNQFGGGLYATLGAAATLRRCSVIDNHAESGGGIFAISESTFVEFEDGVIGRNSAITGGGGIDLNLGAQIALQNSFIVRNSANNAGGGIYVRPMCSAGLFQSTLACNRVLQATSLDYDGGGGVKIGGSSLGVTTLTLRNSILANNSSDLSPDLRIGTWVEFTKVHAQHSLLGNISGQITTTNNVLRSDPLFVNAAAGDFHLRYGSPCIDAGDPAFASSDETDFDSEPRVFGTTVDLGADEFTDTDSDRLPDYWELARFGSLTFSDGSIDGDSDNLNDFEEYLNRTNPAKSDTDGDQAEDGWEIANGYDPLVPDMDHDGMLDGWEAIHLLDPLTDDADMDPDGDGVNNLAEFIADTDPRNSNSVLRITHVDQRQGGIRLEWQGGRDSWQFIEVSDSLLNGGNWARLFGLAPPTPLTNSLIHYDSTNRLRFYRIRAER